MNCKGFCQDQDDGEHLCNGQCLSLNQSCDGNCPRKNDLLDCADICNDIPMHKRCGDDCISSKVPCNGECNPFYEVLCNGECQSSYLQCNGECIDKDAPAANCDRTCSSEPETWICDSNCLKMEKPCHGQCPAGFCSALVTFVVVVNL